MRSANLVIVTLGVAAVIVSAVIALRWRRLPLVAPDRTPPATSGRAALDGLRTLAAAMSAGVIAGALVPGLIGRLVMRILGATSGHAAQGARTDADEIVGVITGNGTLAVVVFVGVLGGVIAALGLLVVRRWLPLTAGSAGVVAGVLLLGTIGVGDALSPDNGDFALLRPTWLAVTLVVLTALLFGVTFTALAARLDAGLPTLRWHFSAIASHAALIVVLFPILFFVAVLYVGGRALLRGEVAPVLAGESSKRIGHLVVGIATVVAAVTTGDAILEIMMA